MPMALRVFSSTGPTPMMSFRSSAGPAGASNSLFGAFLVDLPPSVLPAGDSAPVAVSRMARFGSPLALADALALARSLSALASDTFAAAGVPFSAGAFSSATGLPLPAFVGAGAAAAGGAAAAAGAAGGGGGGNGL